MTIDQLISKMNLYKKEIYRRGLVIGLCVLLPGIVIIIAAGLWLKPLSEPDMVKSTIFYAALILFLMGNIALFAYTITISLPRKLELFCPNCHKSILKIDPQVLVQTGKCDSCMSGIIDLPRAEVNDSTGDNSDSAIEVVAAECSDEQEAQKV